MNEYDSNRILDLTKKINYNLTKEFKDTDCYVLNTCHIREKATEKVYHDIGRLKKEFRNKKKPLVIIAGCVAQAEGDILLKNEKYIDAVVGPQSYHKINQIISSLENDNKKINHTEFEPIEKFDELNLTKNSNSKVSSFITIQEGCDKFCKFCVVPYTRGPEHSRSFYEIINEAKELVAEGTKEIILLGQNVNAYNYDKYRLSDLVYALEKITDLKRIRYTTSHPKDFTEDLIEAHANCKKLMPLLHLPVQSGSTNILKKMNRGHTIEDYLKIIEKLKLKNSKLKFSSDFIIAYPEETMLDFKDTLKLMKQVNFINSYSFIYSPRPGTPAANLKEIDLYTAKQRLVEFQSLADQIKKDFRNKLVGQFVRVLFENKAKKENTYFGRDEYFNSVIVSSKQNLTGTIKDIKILDCNKNTLFGKIIEDFEKKEHAA